MKLLVLGNSDTSAEFSGGESWPKLAHSALEASLGEPVAYEHLVFSAFGPRAAGAAEETVRRSEADIVILPIGTFAFTVGFVWKRVERLFGTRAGRWYRRAEERFDATTRGRGRVRDAVNRGGRSATRAVIGTRPLMSREQAAAAYEGILRALARVENVHIVLVEYPAEGKQNRGRMAERERFSADLQAVAREHRYEWVSAADALAHRPPGSEVITADGFHMNSLGHELLGAYVAPRLIAALQPA